MSLWFERRGTLRASHWDRIMIALAVAHAALLVALPTVPTIVLSLWWNSNTISHNFIHRPFFRQRWANFVFSAYLSLLLGFSQSLWRERHLSHHAHGRHRLRFSCEVCLEAVLVLSLWTVMAAWAPIFFLSVYLP